MVAFSCNPLILYLKQGTGRIKLKCRQAKCRTTWKFFWTLSINCQTSGKSLWSQAPYTLAISFLSPLLTETVLSKVHSSKTVLRPPLAGLLSRSAALSRLRSHSPFSTTLSHSCRLSIFGVSSCSSLSVLVRLCPPIPTVLCFSFNSFSCDDLIQSCDLSHHPSRGHA